MSFVATTVIVLMAYPMAYFMAFRVTKHKILWLISSRSVLDQLSAARVRVEGDPGLQWGPQLRPDFLGFIKEPLGFLLYNPTSVIITLTHAWLRSPFCRSTCRSRDDRSLLEALPISATTRSKRFLRITLPLSLPGVISSSLLFSSRLSATTSRRPRSAAPPAS